MNPRVEVTGDPYICETDPIFCIANVDTLTAWVNGAVNTPASTTYKWYLDGQLNQSADSYRYDYVEYGVAGPTTNWAHEYIVEVIDANGCSGFSDPFHVVMVEAPITHIVATEDTICNGGEVTLTATLENYNLEYLRYQWYKDELTEANRILGAHEPVYTVMPDASTTYYVEVYSSLTNSSSPYAALTDLCTALDTFRVEVVNDPVIDSVVISDTSVCDGGQVTI